jgi:hypothetical protein
LHEVAGSRFAFGNAHDRRRVRDLDVLARLDVGLALLILISEKPSNSVAAAVSNR